jgi:hypothetical protein
MANIQLSINPSVKAAIFEALQAGVSENTALIKEAEIYLKTVESTPVFHLTLIVSSIEKFLFIRPYKWLSFSSGNYHKHFS